jgi:crotonobetainyl-CoA:carnitine CoA-transferase CaiB-like acyl-CoA transferase
LSVLAGLRVLDLAAHTAPLAGQILADLGAEVVAVDAPPWAADVDAALARADVLLESCLAAQVAALSLEPADVTRRHPHLVHVSITPFGRDGPKAHYRGSDLIVTAASGFLYVTGSPGAAPLRISAPQAHAHAGTDAAVAALIALRHRAATGLGQHIDVSAQDSFTLALLARSLDGPLDQPRAERSAGRTVIGGVELRYVYPVRDGFALVQHGILPPLAAFQQRLVAWAIDAGQCDPEYAQWDWGTMAFQLAAGQVDPVAWARFDRGIAELLASLDKMALMGEAVARKLLVAPVMHIGDLLDSPHFAARGFVVRDTDGERVPGAFARFEKSPLVPRRRARVADLAAIPGAWGERPRVSPTAATGVASAPLAGVKVVDLFWVVAGPGATRMLADHGATVVHVESRARLDMARSVPPYLGGVVDPERAALFHSTNANKRNLALDLGTESGRRVLRDLIAWADVFTESFSPGVIERLGFGFEAVRAINPRIIMISSCLLGQTGPWRDYAGFGNLAAAVTGFHALTGRPGAPPTGCFGPYTDFIGVRYNALAILAALAHRERTGEGQYIDMAQAEAAVHFLAQSARDFLMHGHVPAARGNRDPEMAPHGVYRCRGDDRWIAIAVQSDDDWAALCRVAEFRDLAADAALATLSGRKREEVRLDARIEAWTAALDAADVEASLQAAGVAAHAVLDTHALGDEPMLRHRRHFWRIAHPLHGETVIESSRVLFSRTPPIVPASAPTYGSDRDFVLHDLLGYDPARIETLAEEGALW